MEAIRLVGIQVVNILNILLQIYSYVIVVRIILSWIVPPNNSIMQFLVFLTEPILAPIRKLLEPLTRKSAIPLDFSPILALLLISIVSQILMQFF